MMRSRRFRRFRGTKRRGANMIPFSHCQQVVEVPSFEDANCALPFITMDPITSLDLEWAESVTTAPGLGQALQSEGKSLSLLGMRFHYSYAVSLPQTSPADVAALIEVRSAVAVCQVDAAGVPVQFIDLTEQRQAFLGNGILWRGADFIFSSSAITGATIAGSYGGIQQHGRDIIQVKAKRRLESNERVFWVANYMVPYISGTLVLARSLFGVAATRINQR